jgi:hypothetical protein
MKRFAARLFRLSAWRLAVVAAAVIAAVGAVAFGAYTLLNEAEAEVEEIRWGNVTVSIPADSDVDYAPMSSAAQAVAQGIMGPMLLLTTGKSDVLIDAETGEVIHENVLASERAAFDAVLATVEVVETEVAAEAGAPWPYGSTLPSTPRQQWDPFSFIPPDPGTGISVQPMRASFALPGPPWSGPYIKVFNTRSQMWVSWYGEVTLIEESTLSLAEFVEADPSLLEGIHPDDRAAFQRLAETIEISPRPTPAAAPQEQTQ